MKYQRHDAWDGTAAFLVRGAVGTLWKQENFVNAQREDFENGQSEENSWICPAIGLMICRQESTQFTVYRQKVSRQRTFISVVMSANPFTFLKVSTFVKLLSMLLFMELSDILQYQTFRPVFRPLNPKLEIPPDLLRHDVYGKNYFICVVDARQL